MPLLDRDGIRIHYEAHGHGPVVLLSHGYSATHGMWRGQVEALTGQYRVVTWDMRGHGDSDSPDDPALYSERLTVEDMAAILDACGAATAVIGGLSLGGYMSLAFHARFPERVRALMLFDTGPGFRSDDARSAWNRTAERQAAALERDGLAALGASAEVVNSRHRSARGLALAARGMLAQSDGHVMAGLPAIAVPTLVLAGARDEPFLAATEYMARRIPGATRVLVDDAGHAANIDQPAAFNAAVRAFLDPLRTAWSG